VQANPKNSKKNKKQQQQPLIDHRLSESFSVSLNQTGTGLDFGEESRRRVKVIIRTRWMFFAVWKFQGAGAHGMDWTPRHHSVLGLGLFGEYISLKGRVNLEFILRAGVLLDGFLLCGILGIR
jgi:hypothetical protein